MEIAFNHVGMKCSNLEESMKFYTEVMGMKMDFEVEILGKRCVFVSMGPLQLELEEIQEKITEPVLPAAVGLGHIAFEVKEIEKVAEELTSRGATFMIPPFQIRPTRKTAFIKAPDGVLIQLVEDFPEE